MDHIFEIIKQILGPFFSSMYIDNKVEWPPDEEFEDNDPILIMKKLYANFGGNWETVNLMGVGNEDNPGEWNDFFIVNIGSRIWKYSGTTDTGRYYTDNPLHKSGAFHLCYGFYPKLFGWGMHYDYPALVQKGKCKGWRDKNKNFKNDDNIVAIKTSAINFHHGRSVTGDIGRQGAGCQVILDEKLYYKNYNNIKATGVKRVSYMYIPITSCPEILKVMKYEE